MVSQVTDIAQHPVLQLLGIRPTGPEQARVMAYRGRFALMSGGVRVGKSEMAADIFTMRWFEEKENILARGEVPLYWLVGADYQRTKPEFDYILRNLVNLGFHPKASNNVDPGYIEVMNGKTGRIEMRLETKSGTDHTKMFGYSPHGLIGCEASQISEETWHRIDERSAGNRAWVFLEGTFEGSLGWYPALFNAWEFSADTNTKAFSVPSWTNIHMFPGGRNDPEILRLEQEHSDDWFMERIGGRPCPPSGIVFPEVRPDIHIQSVSYVPGEPVHISHVPGYASPSASAILMSQFIDGQIRVFEESYTRGIILKDIIESGLSQKPWWGDDKHLVVDPFAKDQHHYNDSVSDVWLNVAGLFAYGDKFDISQGNERLKSFLKINPETHKPGIVFDPSCKGIISEFGLAPNPFDGAYHAYSWKTDRDGRIMEGQRHPEQKWNHSISAIVAELVYHFKFVDYNRATSIKVINRHTGSRDSIDEKYPVTRTYPNRGIPVMRH